MDPLSIVFEMVLPLPFVWLALFLGRKKLFPYVQQKEDRAKKPVTSLIIGALAVGAFGRAMIRNSNLTDNPGTFIFLILLTLIASFLMIYGCANYAFKKGHHWGWGFLGTFSLLGLLIVALFKDRLLEEAKNTPSSSKGVR